MNIQVGDIIKLENNQPVTVSISLGFFSLGLSVYKGTLLALVQPLLLGTLICLNLHAEINSSCDKKLVLVPSHHSYRQCETSSGRRVYGSSDGS